MQSDPLDPPNGAASPRKSIIHQPISENFPSVLASSEADQALVSNCDPSVLHPPESEQTLNREHSSVEVVDPGSEKSPNIDYGPFQYCNGLPESERALISEHTSSQIAIPESEQSPIPKCEGTASTNGDDKTDDEIEKNSRE